MRIQVGELTVGDIGVNIVGTVDETIAALNIDFVFVKPSGATITRDATSLSGQTATYTTVSGDIDEAGDWHVFLKNVTTGFHYTRESGHKFPVRPKPEDMARQ